MHGYCAAICFAIGANCYKIIIHLWSSIFPDQTPIFWWRAVEALPCKSISNSFFSAGVCPLYCWKACRNLSNKQTKPEPNVTAMCNFLEQTLQILLLTMIMTVKIEICYKLLQQSNQQETPHYFYDKREASLTGLKLFNGLKRKFGIFHIKPYIWVRRSV